MQPIVYTQKNYRDCKEAINTLLNIVIYCVFGYWGKFKLAQQWLVFAPTMVSICTNTLN